MDYKEFFDKYSNLIKLEGRGYASAKKLIIYSMLGNVIKFNRIKVGELEDDVRINIGIPIKSGYGKTIIKNFVKATEKALERRCTVPTSLHPEQLVGKTIIVRDNDGNIVGKPKINKGYLADDCIMHDEAVELLTDRSHQQSRDYINIALDPIGQNEVFKRSVDTEFDDAVCYFPPCTMIFFWHPIPITETVVTRGLLRRLFIVNIVADIKEREDALGKSIHAKPDNPIGFEDWIKILNNLSGKTFNWMFSDRAKTELFNLSKSLIKIGRTYSAKIAEFTDIMWFTLRNRLAKMACVLAALDGTSNVTMQHLRYGYLDLKEFWFDQMTYVEEKVVGSLTAGVAQASTRRKAILDILRENKAFSEETTPLSIDDLVKKTARQLGVEEGSARYYYRGLVRDGIVISKKGKHDSKVWYPQIAERLEKSD